MARKRSRLMTNALLLYYTSSSGIVRQDIEVKSDARDLIEDRLGEFDSSESTLARPESPSFLIIQIRTNPLKHLYLRSIGNC